MMDRWLIVVLGLAGAGALAWFVGLAGIARSFRTVVGILGDMLQRGRAWLREPGNPLRLACIVMALGFTAAGLQSWQRGTTIVQQRADYVALKEFSDERIADLQRGIRGRDTVIERFQELAEQQRRLLENMARQAEQARDEAERARQRADETAREYQGRFDNRSEGCDAALQAMARACPALEGY